MSLQRLLPDVWKEKLRRRAGVPTLGARLENLRRAGFQPRQIIDAGAYRGHWACAARQTFPSAHLLLIEPQPEVAPELEQLCARLGNAQVWSTLLGERSGTARFLLSETNSRIVSDDSPVQAGERVLNLPVKTLAEIAVTAGFNGCELLKLDLQGHELQALAGAGELFGRIEVIITEVSWLRIGNVPLVTEVFAAFEKRSYRPYDIWGLNYRPLDGALWQTDIAFVRADSRLLASRGWS